MKIAGDFEDELLAWVERAVWGLPAREVVELLEREGMELRASFEPAGEEPIAVPPAPAFLARAGREPRGVDSLGRGVAFVRGPFPSPLSPLVSECVEKP